MVLKNMANYLPSDLLKKDSQYRERGISNISAIYMGRNFVGRFVTVGITPTLIHDAYRPQNIALTNPAGIGLGSIPTQTGLITSQVAIALAGNTQAIPLGVGNFTDMHLFLEVTAIGAGTSWTFWNQVQNPITLNWADSQMLVGPVTPAIVALWTGANFYADVGAFGVTTQYAVRWTLDAGVGAITFTLSYALKLGTAGSSGGISQVIYIGSNNGVSVTSGYPILENSEKFFQVDEGDQIWGVALTPSVLKVLELT